MPPSDARSVRIAAWPALAAVCLAIGLSFFACHPGETAPEERYVSIRLNDSLSRYDSVEVLVLSAADTAKLLGRIWAGPLPQPGALPDYRLQDGENGSLAVRVRAWDTAGVLALDQLLYKVDGKPKVISLPVPASGKPGPSTALKSLVLAPGELAPAFDSARLDYAVALAYEQGTVTLTAVPVADSADIRLEGARIAAGVPSDPVDLLVGENELSVRVTVGDSSRLYSIGVTRAPRIVPPDTAKPDTTRPDTVKPDTTRPDTVKPDTTKPPVKGWKYTADVDVNVKSLGLSQGTVLRNFPLLIRLNKQEFNFSEAAADGRDLRFALGGRLLDHEIARWDTAAELAEVWVRVDSIRGDTAFAPLKMFWGNPFAAPISDAAKVFSSSSGHNAVWHLSENGRGTSGEFKDATGRYHGTGAGGDTPQGPRRVEGVVGHGQAFNVYGKPTRIDLPRNFDPGEAWTFQGWVRTDDGTNTSMGVFFAKIDAASASEMRFGLNLENGDRLSVRRIGAEHITNIYLPKGSFVHLGVVFDGRAATFYVDGFQRETTSSWTQGTDAGAAACLGTESSSAIFPFTGSLDEIWFATGTRSAAWMRMAYENQRVNAYLVDINRRSVLPGPGGQIPDIPGFAESLAE